MNLSVIFFSRSNRSDKLFGTSVVETREGYHSSQPTSPTPSNRTTNSSHNAPRNSPYYTAVTTRAAKEEDCKLILNDCVKIFLGLTKVYTKINFFFKLIIFIYKLLDTILINLLLSSFFWRKNKINNFILKMYEI